MDLALNEFRPFHSFQKRGHRVGIAAHQFSKPALSNPFVLEESPKDRELIGGYPKMGDASAKSLVKPVPGAAQQGR
jgi:hypothetical protein